MNIIYDSPRVAISHRRGETGRAVISFAGIGLELGELPHEEFAKTLSGNQHDQFFVIDKQRCWYNSSAQEIIDELTPKIEEFDTVYTLGNSMGGFGAIYFGRHFSKCSAAVAFGAQYSVHPEIVPNERRWREWRDKIMEWRIPHALSGPATSLRAHLFYGRPSRDIIHANLYLANRPPNMALYAIAGAKHRSAGFMKERGCLTNILDLIFVRNEAAEAIADLMKERKVDIQFSAPKDA